jgi:SNF2 family DNA or RNA helicase
MFQVAGVGLNMTAARHGLFLDKQFVPALNQQAVDRMHRIGADDKQAVQIIEYFVKGTVEARMEKILATKKKVFNNIVENDSFLRQLIEDLIKEEANGGK